MTMCNMCGENAANVNTMLCEFCEEKIEEMRAMYEWYNSIEENGYHWDYEEEF